MVDYRRALALDPNYADALNNLGVICQNSISRNLAGSDGIADTQGITRPFPAAVCLFKVGSTKSARENSMSLNIGATSSWGVLKW